MFEYSDAAIRDMNRRNLARFKRLRQLKFDELNILDAVSDVYDKAAKMAEKWYYEISVRAYIAALIEAGEAEKRAKEEAAEEITED